MANEDIVSELLSGTVELLHGGNPVIFRFEDLEAAGETPEDWEKKLLAVTEPAGLTVTTRTLEKPKMFLIFSNDDPPSAERVHGMVAYLDIDRKLREAEVQALAESEPPEDKP